MHQQPTFSYPYSAFYCFINRLPSSWATSNSTHTHKHVLVTYTQNTYMLRYRHTCTHACKNRQNEKIQTFSPTVCQTQTEFSTDIEGYFHAALHVTWQAHAHTHTHTQPHITIACKRFAHCCLWRPFQSLFWQDSEQYRATLQDEHTSSFVPSVLQSHAQQCVLSPGPPAAAPCSMTFTAAVERVSCPGSACYS